MLFEMWSGSRHLWAPWLAFMWLLTGFCGLFCPMCLECDIARHYGECFCWPLLPGSTLALRIGARERHKIRVSVFGCICIWEPGWMTFKPVIIFISEVWVRILKTPYIVEGFGKGKGRNFSFHLLLGCILNQNATFWRVFPRETYYN